MIAVSFPSSVIIEGAILGLNYGLLATGLVLIYRTNRVINFAQGQLGVVAAVFLVKLYYDYGINYWAALAAALLLAAAVGALSELLLRRLFNRPRVMVMVATIGLSQVLFLFTLFPFIRPKKLFRAFPVPVDWSFHIGTFLFPPGEVVTLIVAPVVALGLAAFIRFSPWGLAMRASAENSESARLSGVWVRRTSTVAWTLAGALSAFTAILASPSQTSTLTEVLSPGLLLLALLAALLGGMVSLPVAFFAGIGLGIVQDLLQWNITNPSSGSATVELVLFVLLQLALLVRAASLQKGSRTAERTSWTTGTLGIRHAGASLRKRVGTTGVLVTVLVAALLPLVLDVGRSFLMSQICIYGVIALSLTVLTGWSGQVSLGQFGLVAVGADMAAHLGGSVPLILLLPFAGVVTGLVSMLVGLTALRIRGLYLAVSTLGFALFMQTSVLATSCWTLPLVHRTICSGLPDPQSTLISRPSLFGVGLTSERAFAWFSLAVLVLSVLMVRLWRDRGIARRLISVRDNEVAAGAAGIPVVRTKLMAFALSGFMAGYAGVVLAFATERFSTDTFDPSISILVVSMVVIGGLDAIPGAVLGALYLVGLPAIFGSSTTIQFLTSGVGLMAFILYLPGGMAQVMHQLGDLATAGVENLQARRRGEPPPGVPDAQPEGAVAEVGAVSRRSAKDSADDTHLEGAATSTTTDARPVTDDDDEARSPRKRTRRVGPAHLDISDLVVSFGGLLALDKVSLTVEPGTIMGLIGPNGSGKTTLLDTVSGTVTPTEGSLRLDGEDLADYIPEERAALGLVRSFQDCRLYPELTVHDTLMLCEDARARVSVLATTLQLPWARRSERDKRKAVDGVIGSFGLDRFRHHLTGHLSTGTRRVVDLASIVLAGPRLLLLDEPTAGIAQREAEAFIPLLRQLQEVTGATILLVEHDVPLVFELCSSVIVMQTGSVVVSGPPEVVREDPRALAAYLGASDAALNVTGPVRSSTPGTGTAGAPTPGAGAPTPGAGAPAPGAGPGGGGAV